MRLITRRDASQELEMMGGGGTRIAKLSLVVRLRPPRSSGHLGVWIEGHNVHVADSMDRGTLKDRDRICSRVYHVGCALPPYSTQLDLYNAAGVGAVDALWDGFNSSIIAMGQVGTGKTHSLFGTANAPPGEDLCSQLLSTLFARIRQSTTPQDFSVLISMWDIVTDPVSGVADVTDLLRDPTDGARAGGRGPDSKLACVMIDSLSDALQAIELGRARSENWQLDPAEQVHTALPNRAHGFVRLTLYDGRRRRVSALHLVDLVGNCSLAGAKVYLSWCLSVFGLACWYIKD